MRSSTEDDLLDSLLLSNLRVECELDCLVFHHRLNHSFGLNEFSVFFSNCIDCVVKANSHLSNLMLELNGLLFATALISDHNHWGAKWVWLGSVVLADLVWSLSGGLYKVSSERRFGWSDIAVVVALFHQLNLYQGEWLEFNYIYYKMISKTS